MDRLLPFLETYKGRDKILRLLTYSTKCAAGLVKSPETASQYDNFSKQLSTSRACFRLLDDIPTIQDILSNIKNKKAESSSSIILFVFESFVDVVFNIFDHLSWAIEHKIIISNSSFPDTASTYCWVLSLYMSIFKILMKLSVLAKRKSEIDMQFSKEEKKKLSVQQLNLSMMMLKCLADLLFAVNYLPKGIMWGSYFKTWQVGALGTFSSVISLSQALMM